MKPPFHARAPAFDADAIQATIQRALASAGLDTTAGPMRGVTETLRRALAPVGAAAAAAHVDSGPVVDVVARVVAGDAPPLHGRFETHHFSNDAGRRAYKLYVPAARSVAPRPLLVMLHGCTQSADDFAAGTQMNRLADEHGLLVLYPEQAARANASRCWNWFKPQDQRRGAGEPSLIAGMASDVARAQGADPHRIFVAGLSAGAAMAVVLGETYPDVFAAVGAHSGLAYGSAQDMPSALAAMKAGRSARAGACGPAGRFSPAGAAAAAADHPTRTAQTVQAVPLIVFHGDRDHTVQQANGERLVQQACAAHEAQFGAGTLNVSTRTGVAAGGRRYSCSVHTDPRGQARIESWTLHGAGHAWSGGHASGSYTDSAGPDASAEMLRFFLALQTAA